MHLQVCGPASQSLRALSSSNGIRSRKSWTRRGRREAGLTCLENPSRGQTARAWEPPLSEDSFQMSRNQPCHNRDHADYPGEVSLKLDHHSWNIQAKPLSWPESIFLTTDCAPRSVVMCYNSTVGNYLGEDPSIHPASQPPNHSRVMLKFFGNRQTNSWNGFQPRTNAEAPSVYTE